jgi:hypothetical protein
VGRMALRVRPAHRETNNPRPRLAAPQYGEALPHRSPYFQFAAPPPRVNFAPGRLSRSFNALNPSGLLTEKLTTRVRGLLSEKALNPRPRLAAPQCGEALPHRPLPSLRGYAAALGSHAKTLS